MLFIYPGNNFNIQNRKFIKQGNTFFTGMYMFIEINDQMEFVDII